jgi:hypothetical protein
MSNEQYGFDYDQYGGRPPHVRNSDTSREAAESVLDDARRLRGVVYMRIASSGLVGMTCDEVEEAMNGRHQTISARIKELLNEGRIIDSGKRRATRSKRQARVYLATQNAPAGLVASTSQKTKPWQKVTLGEVAAALGRDGFSITKTVDGNYVLCDGTDLSNHRTLEHAFIHLAKAVREREIA